MFNKQRSLFAALVSTSLVVGAAAPTAAAFVAVKPNPIVKGPFIRVMDIAVSPKTSNNPAAAAVGWRSGKNPARLYMAVSLNGGKSYLKPNGKLRRFPIAGDGRRGLSLAVCRDRIWAGSAANFPGDRATDSDVLITRRRVGGSNAGQAFLTAPRIDRKVRDVDVACAGETLVAVAWLQKVDDKVTARLTVRSQGGLAPGAVNKTFNLGLARMDGGISVAGTASGIHVAWTKGSARNLRYKRFLVGDGSSPPITKQPTIGLASTNARWPHLASSGEKVVVAYTDDGKVRTRLSTDSGQSFGAAKRLIGAGTVSRPSRAHSAALSGQRIVIEATRKPKGGEATPERWQTMNLGSTWSRSTFGHDGPRVGALHKLSSSSSLLKEAWSNDGSIDTLRGQYEKP